MTQPQATAPLPVQAKTSRLAHLDGIRAVAALYVLLHHAWLTVYPQGAPPGIEYATTVWLEFGDYGVTLFIVVSGFSLMLAPLRNGLRVRGGVLSFYRARFLRIFPAYWTALIISAVLGLTVLGIWTGTHWDVSLPVTLRDFVVHALMFQDLSESAKINHVFWSVAVEWHIYFLFPLLLLLWRRRSMWWTTAVIVVVSVAVAWAVGAVMPPYTSDLTFFIWFHFLGCFTLGAAAARIAHAAGAVRIGRREFTPNWALLAVLTFVGTFLAEPYIPIVAVHSTLFGLGAAFLLIALSAGQLSFVRRALQWRPLVWVGISSYSLYLLHAPILQLLWQYVLDPLGLGAEGLLTVGLLIALGLLASLPAARLSFLAVERPFLPKPTRRAEKEELARRA
jgi:peptidoglycan/LPS O-acetylase OafA/YrhL